MNDHRKESGRALFKAWMLVIVVLCFLRPLAGCSDDGTDSLPGWQQIGADGFGDPANRYAWSMAGFKGGLYVGTNNLTSRFSGVFYLLGIYRPGMSGGCQVWRFTPDGQWARVAESGFDGDVANFGVRGMVVFGNVLLAGTVNQNTGLELWQTTDGFNWEQVGADGFGVPANVSTRAMHAYNGYLYLGTENRDTGAELWRSPDGENWERVMAGGFGTTGNFALSSLATFQGFLYAGTWNVAQGGELWRSTDGLNFEPVFYGGNGSRGNEGVMTMAPFESRLYVGTLGIPLGAQLFATSDGTTMETIGERGFGDLFNGYFWTLQEFRGWLYLGTFKWAGPNGLLKNGFDLYRSLNGTNWEALTQDGFGDPANYGVRTMTVMDGALYLGTAGLRSGCQVWRTY